MKKSDGDFAVERWVVSKTGGKAVQRMNKSQEGKSPSMREAAIYYIFIIYYTIT